MSCMRRAFAILAAVGGSVACGEQASTGAGDPPPVSDRTAATPGSPGVVPAAGVVSPGEATPHAGSAEAARCADPVLHIEDGVERGWLCPAVAASLGLTIVDMSERWAPLPFAPGPDGKGPRFREAYLSYAAEEDPDGGELPPEERLVELYGVTPAWSVILRRLSDDARHACHAAIDDAPLALLTRKLREEDRVTIQAKARQRAWIGKRLEKQRKKFKLVDRAALASIKSMQGLVSKWTRLENEHAAIVVMQRHLVCEGLLKKKWIDGGMSDRTTDAMDLYQRGHFLLPDFTLDADDREALAAGSLELDFRAALRVLRERVVDATGLIEDGSAGSGPQRVLGRPLEPELMRIAKGHTPLPDAAPDLIGAATEIAAQALGWTTPDQARSFLARHKGEQLSVAIALPPPPAYHSAQMDLRAVIDRGDVFYDDLPRSHNIKRRPATILYAMDGDVKRPLVRFPTTIGGWADEKMPGGWVKKKWKESDVGKRVWKELYVAPTWQPPKTTPDKDLVRHHDHKWRLKDYIVGPGPRSAYGMAMLVHHKPVKVGKKAIHWSDNGIRSHGTSNVTSVTRGTSHGCHRLFNHLAVRLASFLLRHRTTIRHGDQKDGYRRVVHHLGESFTIRSKTRGYLYELTPPVPIEVTKGRIMTRRKTPRR